MKQWPFDAFEVIPYLDPIENLPLILNDILKQIEFKTNSISSKKIEHES